jgi:hypothetical protein
MKIKKMKKTIRVLWGLPASGKTSFAEEQRTKGSLVIDVDAIQLSSTTRAKFISRICDRVAFSFLEKNETVILDGLITTNHQAASIIDAIRNKFVNYEIRVMINWWEENRDVCLTNDIGRRELSSAHSIKNMPFEIPDHIKLGIPKAHCRKMIIQLYSPEVKYFKDKVDRESLSSMTLCSNSWSGGGSSGNCYNDSIDVYLADPQPEFLEFDLLLEKICPTITFLQYKRIAKKCCSVKTKSESDYYGGDWSNKHHRCDLNLLYQELKGIDQLK